MDAVTDVEGRISRDALQEKGHEDDPGFLCHILVKPAEGIRIADTEIADHLHPGKDREINLR